ncbi:hypothetical protein OG562_15935 [Streptomyces sp. NBC_01275]|uniref:hypothetical protein n=1 Tax=Streptomyces sp. NBC_01275 TaxID=2903807 RepID=UPI00224FC8A6|nr:hypothetical protein [Streptomyces sp. NBC_01275]MCX4762440.1 hypothetical protein [Streptomyces sp. NBC_01275]
MSLRTLTTSDGTHLADRDDEPAPLLPPSSPPSPTRPPFLLLHGLAGHLGEWDDLTARLFSDGHRAVVPNAGHDVHLDQPDQVHEVHEVHEAVSAFLRDWVR